MYKEVAGAGDEKGSREEVFTGVRAWDEAYVRRGRGRGGKWGEDVVDVVVETWKASGLRTRYVRL